MVEESPFAQEVLTGSAVERLSAPEGEGSEAADDGGGGGCSDLMTGTRGLAKIWSIGKRGGGCVLWKKK